MQLPGAGKPFFGRDDERARIAAALRAPGARLVTLTGLGGIGKTALASRIMAELAGAFPDGVHWVSLADVGDPTLVDSAIAHKLGITDASPRPPAAALTEWLAAKQALIVLDNFEHLMAARALVAQLIAAVDPGPIFLITSREPLGIPGECRIEIGPLPLPEPNRLTAETLRDNEAASLFEWRARVVGRAFAIAAGNAAQIAAICRTLEGIPLAIELAAARLHLLGVRGLLEHLRGPHLGLLRSGTAEFPARQRAMSLVIEWSYNLLGAQQELFRRLCVFTGGFSLDAAEAVGLIEDRSETSPRDAGLTRRDALIDRLDELVRLNLVRGLPQADGTVRYLILETIREFGLTQMTPDELADANWAATRYLVLLVERAYPELTGGSEPGEWLARLDAEHGTIRAQLAWLLDQGPVAATTLLRLGSALWIFWKMQGHVVEGATWLNRIREVAADDEGPLLARVTLALGHLEFNDLDRSETLYAQAQEIFRRVGDARGEAEAWSGLGMFYEQRGDYDRSSEAHRQALAIWQGLDHPGGMALASYQLGYAATRAGRYPEALALLDEARQQWERLQDISGVAYATMEMGRAYRLLGRFEEASLLLTLSRDRFARMGARDAAGIVNTELGLLELAAGHDAPALGLLQDAVTTFLALGVTHAYLFESLEGIAAIAAHRRDHRTALCLARFVMQARKRTGLAAPPSSLNLIERVMREAVLVLGAGATPAIKLQADMLSFDEGMHLALTVQGASPTASSTAPPSTPHAQAPYGVLTNREQEVLVLIARGMTDQDIANELSISYRTVTTHVSRVLAKLGASSRTSAAAWAYRLGLWHPPLLD